MTKSYMYICVSTYALALLQYIFFLFLGPCVYILFYKGFNSLMLCYCLNRVPVSEFAIPQKVGQTVCHNYIIIMSSFLQLSCSLLSAVLTEFSNSSGSSNIGMPIEFHVKCKILIQVCSLNAMWACSL